MSDNFGGGIYLTDNSDLAPTWDLDVDESGDIRTVTGIDELNKDVAYATAVEIQDTAIGERLEPVVLRRIKAIVRSVFQDEERIDNILIVNAREAGMDTVEVVAEVRANDETIELVFEVTE